MFAKISDSGPGAANHDTITDFVSGEDRIDLASIDANTTVKGDQAFSYIGSSSFSGVAGELRFANSVLASDINGDGVADFEISMTGVQSLAHYDFLL